MPKNIFHSTATNLLKQSKETKEKGSKLAKIHLLHHFVDNIINFGHADNVLAELVITI